MVVTDEDASMHNEALNGRATCRESAIDAIDLLLRNGATRDWGRTLRQVQARFTCAPFGEKFAVALLPHAASLDGGE